MFIMKNGGYESTYMYVNCHPILFERGEVKGNSRKTSEKNWIGALVSNDTLGLLSTR